MTAPDPKERVHQAKAPRVLLVDDVEANLVALSASLEGLDCELVTAQSGNEALRLLLKGGFAVILLDVQMPHMDGYEVARYARENPLTQDIPIVFLTARGHSSDILQGYGTGAVDYLLKPADINILRSKVRVFLELFRSRQRLEAEIEARKELAAALEKKNAELELANTELEAFSYSVSHDLRAPLRAIDGFIRALAKRSGEKLDEESQHYLERVRNGTDRMNELIDDLLSLSRVSRAELRESEVNLSTIAREVWEDLRQQNVERAAELRCHPALQVRGDAGLLRVLLENLLGNAWKFTAPRAQSIVEVGRIDDEPTTVFVRDNGVGFDMSHASRLFRPFQRLHRTQDFDGTGIGLATVQRIVQRHGGRVWAEGKVDAGATVYFTLAAARGADQPPS